LDENPIPLRCNFCSYHAFRFSIHLMKFLKILALSIVLLTNTTHFMKIIAFLASISAVLAAVSQAETTAENSPEKPAVMAIDRAFEAAYAKADTKAVADFFTEDAHYTSDDGRTFDGRTAIENSIRAAFAKNNGAKLAIALDSVRLLAPDVLLEMGSTTVTATCASQTSPPRGASAGGPPTPPR
jgi:uncharacterized protein (TIGR02246 family)